MISDTEASVPINMNRYQACPCDSKQLYHKCCKRFHDGALPEDAQLLMRSRYCAYALGLVDYIMDTTHPENEAYSADREQWKKELMVFSKLTQFCGLTISEFVPGEERATVTFTAFLKQGAEDGTLSEQSTFVKEQGRWLYRDGVISQ